jgi:hypothetical protein
MDMKQAIESLDTLNLAILTAEIKLTGAALDIDTASKEELSVFQYNLEKCKLALAKLENTMLQRVNKKVVSEKEAIEASIQQTQ